ncbi:MAG TPA: hypothetical protein VK183_12750, partial [Flavobacterium sp.]|nr:hypothetical protein [Flavobacterium sp.]
MENTEVQFTPGREVRMGFRQEDTRRPRFANAFGQVFDDSVVIYAFPSAAPVALASIRKVRVLRSRNRIPNIGLALLGLGMAGSLLVGPPPVWLLLALLFLSLLAFIAAATLRIVVYRVILVLDDRQLRVRVDRRERAAAKKWAYYVGRLVSERKKAARNR